MQAKTPGKVDAPLKLTRRFMNGRNKGRDISEERKLLKVFKVAVKDVSAMRQHLESQCKYFEMGR